MINVNDVPYGALNSLEPDYLKYLYHDEVAYPDKFDELDVPASDEWEVIETVKALFIEP